MLATGAPIALEKGHKRMRNTCCIALREPGAGLLAMMPRKEGHVCENCHIGSTYHKRFSSTGGRQEGDLSNNWPKSNADIQ